MEKLGKPFWIITGVALLFVVGILNYWTGYEIAFSLFYLLPIGLVTWFASRRLGILISFASAGVWLSVDILSGAVYSYPAIYLWNTIVRLSFFLITVFFLRTGKALEHEKAFSQTDYVTGAVNARFFHVLAQREFDRAARYGSPVTIVYMDIDNFKVINDSFGHAMGNKLLYEITKCMERNVRKTDIVARVGGDEFAILLLEAGPDAARMILSKMQSELLREMQENNWPVTFSIGVLTFTDPRHSVDEAINMADRTMYSVKNSGKNNISYIVQKG